MLIHNYEGETIAERSLRYVGIDDFVVLCPEVSGPWRNSVKLAALKKYLDSGSCPTEYVLYMDSDDAVLRADPRKALDLLERERCELLFSSTTFRGAYECMPEIQAWADDVADAEGQGHSYVNSGVYVGRTEFLREVVNRAVEYVSDDDLSREEYRIRRRNGTLCQRLPSFPKGVGCDQVILRYLHPSFYPRMKIDYRRMLALR